MNLLALAALEVWRRPLPQVLGELVMEPIETSRTWRWYGYEDSWIVLDGVSVQSVSGGGHWGGGMFISARDQARFGLMTLRRGRWRDRQVLSEEWIRRALTPTGPQPTYGFMNYFLIGSADLMADDLVRLLQYRTKIPRSVMVEYLKILLAFHLALYHLRLMKLLPELAKRKGTETICHPSNCPVKPANEDRPQGGCGVRQAPPGRRPRPLKSPDRAAS